jgi:hypothetical protein
MSRFCLAAAGVILLACSLAPTMAAEGLDAATPQVKHRIMVCEYSDAAHRLVEIDPAGKLAWEHKFPSVAVCFRLAGDGRVLFADGGNPTGVREVDRQHRTVFDYRAKCEQVMCCDLLPNGSILLAEQGPCRAVEINRQGEVLATVKLATTAEAAHLQTRCVHQLENGHILACHEADQAIREYDRDGSVVWEYPGVSGTFEALRLASGNTLIGGGTQRRLFEVTPQKETVWELTAADAPELNLTWVTSLQILDNGNLVVANFLRGQEGRGAHAFEVTHDQEKKIVWKFADHDLVKSITMVRVLD